MMTDTDSIGQTTSSLERYLVYYLNFLFQHVLLTPSVWYTVARLRNRLFEDWSTLSLCLSCVYIHT